MLAELMELQLCGNPIPTIENVPWGFEVGQADVTDGM